MSQIEREFASKIITGTPLLALPRAMLAARGHVVPAPARWANGRIRLRSIEIARGARRYSAGDGPKEPASNPKSNGKGFSFGASTASPGPRAGEPRPQPPPIPKVRSARII